MTVKNSSTTTRESKRLLEDLQARLKQEVEEREAEAAVYSSNLYHLEKEKTDWYLHEIYPVHQQALGMI